MSGVISAYGQQTASLFLDRAVTTLASRQQALQTQASTGVRSDSYAGLDTGRMQALSLQPALTQIRSWSGNVTTAQNRLSVTQNALTQIGTLGDQLTTSLAGLSGHPDKATVDAAALQARQALQSLGGLLNAQSGDTYVFAGQGGNTAPVTTTDLSESDLAHRIAVAVRQDGSGDAAGILSSTLTMAGATAAGSPFSAGLSVSPQQAAGQAYKTAIGRGEVVTAGMTATQGQVASDTSTGSPMRDLMRNLMVVASLNDASVGTSAYQGLIQGLASSNQTVTSGLSDVAGQLGVAQDTLTFQSSSLDQMTTALTAQLGDSKDADLAAVSTQLTQTQNQLEASYSIIANMKGMTLASYL